MWKPALVLLVVLFVSTSDALARCGPSRLSGGITKPVVIKLNAAERGVREAPAFYIQLPHLFVLLYFKPEDVVAQLKAQKSEEYLAAISRDLPLERDTDLFKYILENNRFHFQQEFLISDLLKLGQAYIDDWPYRDAKRDPSDDRGDRNIVVMVSKMGAGEEWRLFCEPLGLDGDISRTRELFFATYVYVD